MAKQSDNSPEATTSLSVSSEAAERFFKSFEKSAKRWEMIVYPGMVLVVLFMAYGFYMIYNLTNDMRTMVARFDDPQIVTNLNSISDAMHSLSTDIHAMTNRVEAMARDTTEMSKSTGLMAKKTGEMTSLMESVRYMKSMDAELKKMNQTMYVMGGNVNYLRQDMAIMNRNISRPMNMMNSVLPF